MRRKSRDNNKPRRGSEGLRVEKRDKSKVIVKEAAPKGQKKISLKQLRREGGKGGKKALVLSKKGGQKEGKKGDMRSKKDLGRRNKRLTHVWQMAMMDVVRRAALRPASCRCPRLVAA